jgi:O-antigen/teichoic acid export membrane protein
MEGPGKAVAQDHEGHHLPAIPMSAGRPLPRSNAATIARNSAWMTADTLSAVVSGLIANLLVWRTFSPEVLGYYNYMQWVASLANTVANLGVPAATGRYAAEAIGRGEVTTARAIIRTTLRFQLIIATVVMGIGLMLVLGVVAPERRGFAIPLALSLGPLLVLGIATNANNASEELGPNARASIAANLVNLGGVAVSIVFHLGLVGIASGLLVSRGLDRRRFAGLPPPPPISAELRQRIIRFCRPAIVLMLLDALVWDRSEMFFLERFAGIHEVAYYGLAFGTAQYLLLMPRTFSYATSATIMAEQGRAPERLGRLAVNALRFTVLLALPLAIGMAALAGPLLRVLYSSRSLPALPALTTLALLCTARAMTFPAQQFLLATERQASLMRFGLAAAVFNVILDLILIPRFGGLGAALAKGTTFVFAAIGLWTMVRAAVGLRFPAGPLLRLLAATAVMGVLVAAVARLLPPLPAVLLGVPLGALVFAVGLRLSRFLDRQDLDRLRALARALPAPARPLFERLCHFVCPPAASLAASPALP